MIVTARPPKRTPPKKPTKPPIAARISAASVPGKRRYKPVADAADDPEAEARVQAFLARMIRPREDGT
jgi:hypothetical protein